MPTTWALQVTPCEVISPVGTFEALVSFEASIGSNRPAACAAAAGPGSSTKQSKGGTPRAARTLATWSTAKSESKAMSTLAAFFSAGATTAR
jgi:hypothetical protein